MEIKDIIQMVLTILGSGAALGFVEFLIKRKDERQDKKEEKEEPYPSAWKRMDPCLSELHSAQNR